MFFGIDGSEDAEKFKQMGGTVNAPIDKTVAPTAVSAPVNQAVAPTALGAPANQAADPAGTEVTTRRALAVASDVAAPSIPGALNGAASSIALGAGQQAPQLGNEMALPGSETVNGYSPIGWRGRGISRKFTSETDANDEKNYAHEFNQAAYPTQSLISHANGSMNAMAGMAGEPSTPNAQGHEQALFEQAFRSGNEVPQKQSAPVDMRLT